MAYIASTGIVRSLRTWPVDDISSWEHPQKTLSRLFRVDLQAGRGSMWVSMWRELPCARRSNNANNYAKGVRPV